MRSTTARRRRNSEADKDKELRGHLHARLQSQPRFAQVLIQVHDRIITLRGMVHSLECKLALLDEVLAFRSGRGLVDDVAVLRSRERAV